MEICAKRIKEKLGILSAVVVGARGLRGDVKDKEFMASRYSEMCKNEWCLKKVKMFGNIFNV